METPAHPKSEIEWFLADIETAGRVRTLLDSGLPIGPDMARMLWHSLSPNVRRILTERD